MNLLLIFAWLMFILSLLCLFALYYRVFLLKIMNYDYYFVITLIMEFVFSVQFLCMLYLYDTINDFTEMRMFFVVYSSVIPTLNVIPSASIYYRIKNRE